MSLKLVTTEKFGELDCNFYRNMNDEVLLTREQIGSALEYSQPQQAITKLHNKHKDRMDSFSVCTKLVGTDGKQYNTYLYTTKGVMEICRWSRQPKADAFMDFVWEVMDKLIHNEPLGNIDINAFASNFANIFQNQLDDIKSEIKQISSSKHFTGVNRWKKRIFEKCNLIVEYLGIPLKTILSNLFMETENMYDVDFSEYVEDCILKTGETNPYTLNIIDCNNDLRKMFETTVDSVLSKYGLEYNNANKRHTIFDEVTIDE